jgi:hypothetical protein
MEITFAVMFFVYFANYAAANNLYEYAMETVWTKIEKG